MRRRRDRDHHAETLRAAALLLGAAVFAAGGAPSWADVQKVAADGTVHRIDVEPWSQPSGKTAGTALRHTRQDRQGALQSALIPGTDDLSLDRDPALEVDAASGALVLAWSRSDGGAFVVCVSRFENGSWSPARPAAPGGVGDQSRPEVRIASTLIHITWRLEAGAQSGDRRVSLDRSSLALTFGPEQLPLPDTSSPPPSGPTTPDPPRGDSFFAREAPPRFVGDPGRLIVWGVRDAPVPVDYSQCLPLPADVRNVSEPTARWIRGSFLVSYLAGSRFYYTVRSGATWTEHRVVNLGASMSAAEARLKVEEMVLRGAPTN